MSNINRDETIADLGATVDYIAQITEQSDNCEFELAAELHDAVGRVAAAAKLAQDMLMTQMLQRLEDGGPRVFGKERFERTRKYVERTDHDAVINAVVAQAEACMTPQQAARFAAELMRSAYLSKSVDARKGAVDKLSVARDAVFSKEYTGWKLDRTEVPGDDLLPPQSQ